MNIKQSIILCVIFYAYYVSSSTLQTAFDEAVENVNNLNKKPDNKNLLELYGLFKQATVGNINTDRPGAFDFKGKAKWDAWNGRKFMNSETAKQEYVDKAQKLIDIIGVKNATEAAGSGAQRSLSTIGAMGFTSFLIFSFLI